MTRLRRLCVIIASLAASAPAWQAHAQEGGTVTAEKDTGGGQSADSLEPGSDPGFLQGGGYRMGELVLHPLLELQTGYQSNVFYEDDGDGDGENGSALMRLTVGGGIGTKPIKRLAIETGDGEAPRPKLAVRGDLALTWHQYLSGNDAVMGQSDLGIGALLDLKFNPEGVMTFLIRDAFTRSVAPPAIETADKVNRDKNELLIGGVYKPGGGAIQAYANYQFAVEFFEDGELSFANRNSHTVALGAKWQWLPKTQFNGEVSLGIMDSNDASTPLRAYVGASTLITPTFGTVLRLGYQNGFYDNATFSYLDNLLVLAEGRLAIGPTVRVAFGYAHEFADTIIASYYVDNALYARFGTQFGGRTQLRTRAELRLRDYSGVPMTFQGAMFCGDLACSTSDRSDILARVDASLDYQMNPWLILGAAYAFNSTTTDFYIVANGDADSAGYVWHEFVVKATAKF